MKNLSITIILFVTTMFGLSAQTDGIYTPTLTNIVNVAGSSAYPCQWTRVGDVVTVSGRVDIDPTSTVATRLAFSLPVSSAFTEYYQLGGTAVSDLTPQNYVAIKAETAGNKAEFSYLANSTLNRSFWFIFQYVVL